ncbi:unnamed protein product, partial [Iphiclides podalirius]
METSHVASDRASIRLGQHSSSHSASDVGCSRVRCTGAETSLVGVLTLCTDRFRVVVSRKAIRYRYADGNSRFPGLAVVHIRWRARELNSPGAVTRLSVLFRRNKVGLRPRREAWYTYAGTDISRTQALAQRSAADEPVTSVERPGRRADGTTARALR